MGLTDVNSYTKKRHRTMPLKESKFSKTKNKEDLKKIGMEKIRKHDARIRNLEKGGING